MPGGTLPGHFGQVYTWGFCTHGQLGLKEKVLGAREYVELPTQAGSDSVLSDAEIRGVACGHFHTLAVDTRGNVFAFGRDDRGQLGHGGENDEVVESRGAVPRRVKSLAHYVVKDVACGAFHCLALTVDGTVLSWGWNKHGQLGRHTDYQTDATPGRVQDARDAPDTPARNIAAGFAHSAAVLRTCQVLVWGSNKDEQLGVGSAVQHPDVAVTPLVLGGVVGRQVATGDCHLLVLDVDGMVFAAGDAGYCQLGIGPESVSARLERCGRLASVPDLPRSEHVDEERVVAVACGGASSAALTSRGRLFTWGGGIWGQLGRGDRDDGQRPAAVLGLPWVRHVELAQDHILAVCCKPPPDGIDGTGALVSDPASWPSSLWAWGRRRLLPSGLGKDLDSEAQRTPACLPLEMLGAVGILGARGGGQVTLHAACGGSHSIAVVVPVLRDTVKTYHGAAWCPRQSTVTGPGAAGGEVSEPLAFRIVTRNADGRDEKVGGLRFRVWASAAMPAESSAGAMLSKRMRSSTSRSSSSKSLAMTTGSLGKQLSTSPLSMTTGSFRRESPQDDLQHVFDLQQLLDCANGTYEGVYIMRRTGEYLLHVHMLPRDAEQSMQEDRSQCRGEPVSGSPFRIAIDSGRAFAPHCSVQLRCVNPISVAASDVPGEKDVFVVQASQEAVWEVLACDVFGNSSTRKTDRFVASMLHVDEEIHKEQEADEQNSSSIADLAVAMGMPPLVEEGESPMMAALRERARRRNAERMWMGTHGSSKGSAAVGQSPREVHLTARPSKEAGKHEIRWTPTLVGHYSLSVLLSGPAGPQSVRGSAFEVSVVAGKVHAGRSRLLVAGAVDAAVDAASPTLPAFSFVGDPPEVEIPVRLLLQDKTGNPCWERLDPLSLITTRVESASILGSEEDLPRGALAWKIKGGGGPFALTVRLRATPALLAVASAAPGRGPVRVVQLFISACERISRERLWGSPCRVQLLLDVSFPAPSSGLLPVVGTIVTPLERQEMDCDEDYVDHLDPASAVGPPGAVRIHASEVDPDSPLCTRDAANPLPRLAESQQLEAPVAQHPEDTEGEMLSDTRSVAEGEGANKSVEGHAFLSVVSDARLDAEGAGSKDTVEGHVVRPVDLFSSDETACSGTVVVGAGLHCQPAAASQEGKVASQDAPASDCSVSICQAARLAVSSARMRMYPLERGDSKLDAESDEAAARRPNQTGLAADAQVEAPSDALVAASTFALSLGPSSGAAAAAGASPLALPPLPLCVAPRPPSGGCASSRAAGALSAVRSSQGGEEEHHVWDARLPAQLPALSASPPWLPRATTAPINAVETQTQVLEGKAMESPDLPETPSGARCLQAAASRPASRPSSRQGLASRPASRGGGGSSRSGLDLGAAAVPRAKQQRRMIVQPVDWRPPVGGYAAPGIGVAPARQEGAISIARGTTQRRLPSVTTGIAMRFRESDTLVGPSPWPERRPG